MKKIYRILPIIIIATIALLGVSVMSMGEEEDTFTPVGQKWAPVPTGHIVGKDNDEGFDTKALHFSGIDCGICHTTNGRAGNYVFSVSGTVFKDKTGKETLEEAEIILKDADGNIISMTSNSAGNFYTYAPVAFTPVEDDDPDNPRNWRYKAWVKYGDTVRPMNYLAYIGSNRAPRMSCNMHHGSGIRGRGTLSTGNFSTLPSFPRRNISFENHVRPILKNRCKACHMPASMHPVRSYYPNDPEPFDYSGGLDLSSYNKDPDNDKGVPEIVNTVNPEFSLILSKTVTGSTHSGGAFWDPKDIEFRVIEQWIAEGAQNN